MDPTDQPDVHHTPLFVAAIFPKGMVSTKRIGHHVVGVLPDYRGQEYTYYFGSAWAKYDIRTVEEWQDRIAWFLRSLESPLHIFMNN